VPVVVQWVLRQAAGELSLKGQGWMESELRATGHGAAAARSPPTTGAISADEDTPNRIGCAQKCEKKDLNKA